MHRTRLTTLFFAAALAACSPSNTPDAAAGQDASTDSAAPGADAAASEDTATEDTATPVDAPAPTDAMTPVDVVSPPADAPTDTAADAPAPTDGAAPTCASPAGAPPDLMGPGACGTLEFGQPAVPVADVTAPIVFTGGAIPPGIYDVVRYSRTSGSLMTTMRATLVIASDGRFTEIRSLDTGSGTPPVTRKSGTYTIEGNSLVRAIPCGSATGMPETNRLPFTLECSPTEVLLHMGTTNLWFTYRRR